MLSVNRVGHCKLVIHVILDKGIETASVDIGLKHDLAICNLFGIDFHQSDMLAVNWRVKEVELSVVNNKVRARLAIFNQNRLFSCSVD